MSATGRGNSQAGMTGAVTAACAAVVVLAGALAFGRHHGSPGSGLSASPFHTMLGGVAQAQTHAGPANDPAALSLYRRTLRAQATAPVTARVRLTQWSAAGEAGVVQVIDVIEGAGGRYRFTYAAPPGVKGRVLVCDGENVYQYEPSKRLVTRRPAAPAAGVLEAEAASLATRRATFGAPSPAVAGRKVRTLELWSADDGALRERRWVDEATGRTLRVETYGKAGKIVRRAEMTRVTFGQAAPASAFVSRFPEGTRLLAAAPERAPDAAGAARRLGLPTAVGAYRVRTAVAPRPGDGSHLLYSDGLHAISLFVTDAPAGTDALRQGPGWTPYRVAPSVDGFTHEEPGKGQAAVAWARDGRRYVAVSRLPLGQLLDVADDLAAGVK
jgi:outer membrane lipoprotein-sorting protein